MNIKYSIFFAVLILLTFLFGINYYDNSNYKKLHEINSLIPAEVEKEISYIKKLKSGIETWEEANKPYVIKDGFNLKVSAKEATKKEETKAVRGGSINVHVGAEPKTLIPWLDNSAYTALISSYIFDTLLTTDSQTFAQKPSLAKSFYVEDIVWLKGRMYDSKFVPYSKTLKPKANKDNAYVIGTIEDIVRSNKSSEGGNGIKNGIKKDIKYIKLRVSGKSRIINASKLRYKVDPTDKSYKRAFDREVIYTFDLRKGVRWHDGKEFSADDVIFSLDVIKNEYIPELSHLRLYYSGLKYWEKLGRYKVRLYFDTNHFKLKDLAGGFIIIPKHLYLKRGDKYTKKEFARHFAEHKVNRTPVGTGPYYFPSKVLGEYNKAKAGLNKAWVNKEYISLVRNDEYFNAGKRGYLKKIYFRFIPNRETAFIELKNGNIDFMSSLGSQQFFKSSISEEFKAKYTKVFYYTGGFSYIGYNMKKVYFADKRVRQAITMLLDRKRILKNFLYGLGKIVSGNQYYFGPGYNHNIKPYEYNREKAIELLNEAGWFDNDGDGIREKDGVPFSIELLYPQGSTSASTINPILYEELKSVGINLTLTRLEWASFINHLRDRRFDMCILGWGTPLESDPYQLWHSSQWSNKGSNHVGFTNEAADRLIEKIRRTLDDEERVKLHFKLHALLHKEQPYLFLYTIPNKAVYNSRYRNVKFYRTRPGFNLSEWYIPKDLQTQEEKEAEKEAEKELEKGL